MKAFNKIALLVVAMIAFTGLVNAYDIGIVKEIQINNNAMFKAPSLTGGAEVNARIVHEYSDVTPTSDSSSLFEIDAGDTAFKSLKIRVPLDTNEESIDLHIIVI